MRKDNVEAVSGNVYKPSRFRVLEFRGDKIDWIQSARCTSALRNMDRRRNVPIVTGAMFETSWTDRRLVGGGDKEVKMQGNGALPSVVYNLRESKRLAWGI